MKKDFTLDHALGDPDEHDDGHGDEPRAPTAPYVIVTPPRSFITNYVIVAGERTDAPLEAHELSAVLVQSALAGPRVTLPMAYRTRGARLVLWGMNIVDSASGRKTTVNEFGCDVLCQVLGDPCMLPWKGSPEAFLQILATRDGKASVFARDEYSGLLASMKRGGYTAGLAQDFIRAYDGRPITMARTKKRNQKGEPIDDSDRVKDPYLVKICAATRTSFVSIATIDDVLDGLLSRFVFTSGRADEQPPKRMTASLERAWDDVVTLARAFRDRAEALTRIEISDAVLAAHWTLESSYKAAAQREAHPEAAGPAMQRLAETVLKVSALLAIDRGGTEVELDDLTAAAAMGERWKRTTLAVIADIGRTLFQSRCDAVLKTILANPKGISLAKLYRTHRDLDKRDFVNVLDALVMQRLIHTPPTDRAAGQVGRIPVVYYPGPPGFVG